MPFILATLLSVNIVIVQRRGGNILVSPFQELVKHKKRFSSVYILKTRDHFDGLCKLSSIFPLFSNTTDSFSNNSGRSNIDTLIDKHQTARRSFSPHNESCLIGQPVAIQGLRSPVGDQAEIEKCITGKPSLNPVLDNSLTENHPPFGFPEHTPTPSETSKKNN